MTQSRSSHQGLYTWSWSCDLQRSCDREGHVTNRVVQRLKAAGTEGVVALANWQESRAMWDWQIIGRTLACAVWKDSGVVKWGAHSDYKPGNVI